MALPLGDIEFEAAESELASVPGTEGDTSGDSDPNNLAGGSTADSGGGPPATIPYSRFKEVNDAYRPYKELADLGYNADQLRQLANFEMSFMQDPVGTWLHQARDMDLPDEIKAAVQRHLDGGTAEPPPTPKNQGEAGTEEEPPPWAKPVLQDLEERKKREQSDLEEQAATARKKMLEDMLAKWDEADKRDNIETPRNTQLAYIMANSHAGMKGPEEVLEAARSDWLEARSGALQSAVKTRNTPSPLSVPGSGATAVDNPNEPPKDMATARKLAQAFLEKEAQQARGGE